MGEAAEDGPDVLVPVTRMGAKMAFLASGFSLAQCWPLRPPVEVNQQMDDLLPPCLCNFLNTNK